MGGGRRRSALPLPRGATAGWGSLLGPLGLDGEGLRCPRGCPGHKAGSGAGLGLQDAGFVESAVPGLDGRVAGSRGRGLLDPGVQSRRKAWPAVPTSSEAATVRADRRDPGAHGSWALGEAPV